MRFSTQVTMSESVDSPLVSVRESSAVLVPKRQFRVVSSEPGLVSMW